MNLHPGEEIVFHGHPSWRGLLSFYVRGLGAALVIAVVVAVITRIGLGLLAAAALGAGVVVVGFVRRMATIYLVTSQRLTIQRGVIARQIQHTRIDRVQNVNITQTALQRLLRVGTVDFETAGNSDSGFRFTGLAGPNRVVAAVDRAHRMAAERIESPRFVSGGTSAA